MAISGAADSAAALHIFFPKALLYFHLIAPTAEKMKKLPRYLTQAAHFLARHSAIIALAVFAVAGAAVLDDYGVSNDEVTQREIGYASFNYILGDEDALIEGHSDMFYGVAFEVPLIVAERVFGLEDSRDIYLSRHLITHLVFLAGGFFAWLLAYRLFGSRLIALLAMLLFLLHPRLYAHSFFNSKDLPFLSALMIALYLTHRAFRRDTVWAFALCGAGVGLLVNIRVMGVMLIPAVLGMLALDAFYAVKRGGSKRALSNICAFSTMCAATLYAAWPLLWSDPLNLADAFGTMSQHPTRVATLFRGEFVQWPRLPWDYVPTWMLITTPPVALALAALGIAYLARLCAARRLAAFENSTARFGLLALACLTLPVVAVVALNSNMYHGWKHVYFLYAPLCVLAAFGLRALARLPRPNLRAAAFALAALGTVFAGVQMVRLHPYQHEYFNALVDKSGLADRWAIIHVSVSGKEALEFILETQPNGRVAVTDFINGGFSSARVSRNMRLLPEDARRRPHINRSFPSFIIVSGGGQGRHGDVGYDASSVIWKREIYGAPFVSVLDSRAESEAAFHATYEAARAAQPDASAGGFDMYADGGKLAYVKEDCAEEDTRGKFVLSALPVDQVDLPKRARTDGAKRELIYFDFFQSGAIFDGKCVIVRDLPRYPISHLETWRYAPGESRAWSARILIDESHERYRRALASLSGEPAMRSAFDVYTEDGALIYVKESCAEDDARGRFFLSAFPADPRDLPQTARDAGLAHEPLNFHFDRDGAIFDGKCVAIRGLPDYPISHVETGQFALGEGELWSAVIPFDAYYDRYRRALASLSSEPAMRSDFDVYMEGGALTYVKEGCEEYDTRGRFFLSVFPADPRDLPQTARDAGLEHEPLNFDFAERGAGAIFDGKCAIIQALPDYPISRVETGQFAPGEGELWSGEILFDGYYERYRDALASLPDEPAMRSNFDVYMEDGALTYVKEDCAEDDTRGRFFLAVFPIDPSDLSQYARDAGFEHEPLNFDFAERGAGAIFDGKCVIIRDLPDYPISKIETGQFTPGEGELWGESVEIGD